MNSVLFLLLLVNFMEWRGFAQVFTNNKHIVAVPGAGCCPAFGFPPRSPTTRSAYNTIPSNQTKFHVASCSATKATVYSTTWVGCKKILILPVSLQQFNTGAPCLTMWCFLTYYYTECAHAPHRVYIDKYSQQTSITIQ